MHNIFFLIIYTKVQIRAARWMWWWNVMMHELSALAWKWRKFQFIICKTWDFNILRHTKHLLTLELRRATFRYLSHTCSPLETQILDVNLWIVYFLFVWIIRIFFIKASNLSVLPHISYIYEIYAINKFDDKIVLL